MLGTPLARELQRSRPDELRPRLRDGLPVDARRLEGWAYRGVSIGLPALVERMTWKTFQKTFWRCPETGRLLGWNVRIEQDGLDAPSRPKRRGPDPFCLWHYEVVSPLGVDTPSGFDRGLIIDYARGLAPTLDMRFVKDPLVAVEAGNAEVLLGVSYLALPWAPCVVLPTWFTLEREHPIDFVPPGVRTQAAPQRAPC